MKNHLHENLNDSFLQQIIMCGLVNIDSANIKEECHFNRGPDTDNQYTNMQIFKAETESNGKFVLFLSSITKATSFEKIIIIYVCTYLHVTFSSSLNNLAINYNFFCFGQILKRTLSSSSLLIPEINISHHK